MSDPEAIPDQPFAEDAGVDLREKLPVDGDEPPGNQALGQVLIKPAARRFIAVNQAGS